MTYRAKITRTQELEFDFEEDDLEGETPEYAAAELALTFSDDSWDDVFDEVEVYEIEQ